MTRLHAYNVKVSTPCNVCVILYFGTYFCGSLVNDLYLLFFFSKKVNNGEKQINFNLILKEVKKVLNRRIGSIDIQNWKALWKVVQEKKKQIHLFHHFLPLLTELSKESNGDSRLPVHCNACAFRNRFFWVKTPFPCTSQWEDLFILFRLEAACGVLIFYSKSPLLIWNYSREVLEPLLLLCRFRWEQ